MLWWPRWQFNQFGLCFPNEGGGVGWVSYYCADENDIMEVFSISNYELLSRQ